MTAKSSPKAIRLTVAPREAQYLANAMTGRIAYLKRYGHDAAGESELQWLEAERARLWAYLTHMRSV